MQCDYYAARQAELAECLKELERATERLDQARQARDKQERQKAKQQMTASARKAVGIEPHLAFLWFWSKRERANGPREARIASEAAHSIRDAWQETMRVGMISEVFHGIPESATIAHTPPLSFMLHIPFQLHKPCVSKDERDFHLLDNPLRKEKVFQTPMVASTSWKGALRAALWQLDYKEDKQVTIRLLGNRRESDEHQVGRLHFFPTFFDKLGLEVINPHSRKTGVGERGPILMECVPQGARGDLFLLYVPVGPPEQSEGERRAQVAQDLEVLVKGVKAMLTTYGFGAKTSSGYGTAEGLLAGEGSLSIRAGLSEMMLSTTGATETTQPNTDLPHYQESPTRLHADFRRPDGDLKSEEGYQALIESRGQEYATRDQRLYARARGWWEREGRALAGAVSQELESEPEPAPTDTRSLSKHTFRTLSELCSLAQRVAAELQNGGES